MSFRKGDPVRFFINGQFRCGVVREDERPEHDGLIDVEAEDGVWYGLSRRILTPLSETADAAVAAG